MQKLRPCCNSYRPYFGSIVTCRDFQFVPEVVRTLDPGNQGFIGVESGELDMGSPGSYH